jgi:sugar-specific transcriptional regulator TrmB
MLRLYKIARTQSVWPMEEFAGSADVSAAEIEESLERLESLGLLVPSSTSPSGYRVIDPGMALSKSFAAEAAHAAQYEQQAARTRRAITTLVEEFQSFRGVSREHVEIELLHGPERVNAFLDDVVNIIRIRGCVMHPGGVPPVELIDDMLLRDKDVVSRRIQARALHMRHVANVDYVQDHLVYAAREGVEVRVAQNLPLPLMVFDDDTALTAIDPKDSAAGAIAVRGRELVRSSQALFDFCWFAAEPIGRAAAEREDRPVVHLTPSSTSSPACWPRE